MIIWSDTLGGWLKAENLIKEQYPNSSPDFLDSDLEACKTWAIDQLQKWRGDQRAKMGLSSAQWQDLAYAGKAAHCRAWLADQPQPYTTPEYIEARRWQQQPDTALALDTGRMSAAEYAAAVVNGYETGQRTLKMRLSLLAQAKTIEEIQAILGRL